MTKERLLAAGFKRLYIRDVPMGNSLTPANTEDYPLVATDTWVTEDGKLMIEPTGDGKWMIYLITPSKYIRIRNTQKGDLDYVLEQVKKYYESK